MGVHEFFALPTLHSSSSLTDTQRFLPGACERIETHLAAHVVGQDLATGQLVDAVCTHLAKEHPAKPLIISVRGMSA